MKTPCTTNHYIHCRKLRTCYELPRHSSQFNAWNALFGLTGRQGQPGELVLAQGTGGVSIAALQFAVAVGANVVATTSSSEKASRLEALGPTHILNYREVPAWGSDARALTSGSREFDFIVDVGGNVTLFESLKAIRTECIIVATGSLGGTEPVPMLAAFMHACTVRGILLKTRTQLRDLARFVEDHQIIPVVDDVTFDLT